MERNLQHSNGSGKSSDSLLEHHEGGKEALFLALENGDFDVVSALLDSGIDINSTNREARTCLMIGCVKDQLDICTHLLCRGCEIDAVDSGGYTALHLATYYEREDLVRLLLVAGADRHIKNLENQSALDIALQQDGDHILALFLLYEGESEGYRLRKDAASWQASRNPSATKTCDMCGSDDDAAKGLQCSFDKHFVCASCLVSAVQSFSSEVNSDQNSTLGNMPCPVVKCRSAPWSATDICKSVPDTIFKQHLRGYQKRSEARLLREAEARMFGMRGTRKDVDEDDDAIPRMCYCQ